ncbi:hypothetical protein [Crossiella sp. NPDC003009]
MPEKLRVGETLGSYTSCCDDPADWQALMAKLGLADERDGVIVTLSGGHKQRLSMGLASARRQRR